MFSLLVLLCCLGAMVSSAPQKVFYDLEDAHTIFEEFVKEYNKEYKNEAETQARFEIFKSNLEDINTKNKMYPDAVFGINQFTDVSHEEFSHQYTGCYIPGGETQCRMQLAFNHTLASAPDSFDWRTQNKVTNVKAQGKCGSCWAFSTVGNVESQYAIKYNQLINLSEQQLVDCVRECHGCGGGWMSTAILSTQRFGGLLSNQNYPYKAVQGTCAADPQRIAARITGCRQFVFNRETEVADTLVQVGPLAIGLAARNLQGYRGGIIQPSMCNTAVDHAVLLVGYGSESGKPYWVIKNSWGSSWGESGFFRIARNQNTCNLMNGQFVSAVVG